MSDRELDAIRQKRLRELRRHLERKTETEIKEEKAESPQEILNHYFIGRAWEVFDAANVQYPEAAKYVENVLVKLIRGEKMKTQISGEELYGLFLRLGFRVRLRTRITVLEHGKVKSLEDKIKEETSQ
jgi:DNA-binding TFAR19-related protein (PDSD5 family)